MNIRPAFREVTNLLTDNPPPHIPPEELKEDYMAVAVKHGGHSSHPYSRGPGGRTLLSRMADQDLEEHH